MKKHQYHFILALLWLILMNQAKGGTETIDAILLIGNGIASAVNVIMGMVYRGMGE